MKINGWEWLRNVQPVEMWQVSQLHHERGDVTKLIGELTPLTEQLTDLIDQLEEWIMGLTELIDQWTQMTN